MRRQHVREGNHGASGSFFKLASQDQMPPCRTTYKGENRAGASIMLPLMNFRTSALTTTPLALQMHTTYRADNLLQSRTQFHGGYHLQDSETIKSIPLRTSKAQLEDLVLNVRHICERFFWQKYVTVHEVYRTHEVP